MSKLLGTNHAVVYKGNEQVSVEEIAYPTFADFQLMNGTKRNVHHGAIIKPILTGICGSDQHMVRGRVGVKPGMILGHEITGEVVEVGRDVEFIKPGDIVSVPFNIACGRCKNCIERKTQLCLTVNSEAAGGAYGYAQMGGWPGGQAEYVMVPYADFNLLKFPDKNLAMKKLLDLAMLSDILPTGYDAALRGGVSVGKTVYIAGAGPVGICCAASCFLLGASKVIISDFEVGRLECAKKLGCFTIDMNKTKRVPEAIKNILGEPNVDCGIDCVGFESNGHHGRSRGSDSERAEVLNDIFQATDYGGNISIPGLYMPVDTGSGVSEVAKKGGLILDYGTAWTKGISIAQGQCPVMQYNRNLMNCILSDKLTVAEALNVVVLPLDKASEAFKKFDQGSPNKFLLDPHGIWQEYQKSGIYGVRK